jgi:hypothetical protein
MSQENLKRDFFFKYRPFQLLDMALSPKEPSQMIPGHIEVNYSREVLFLSMACLTPSLERRI